MIATLGAETDLPAAGASSIVGSVILSKARKCGKLL